MSLRNWLSCKCACVHPDGYSCARIRDGFDADDEHWQRRECECACHDKDYEDEMDDL